MLGIQLPICSIVFSFFLLIIYHSKDRVKTKETKIFSIMLIVSLIDSVIVSILQLFGFNLSNFIVEILNKIDFTLLAIFGTCIFLYTFLVPSAKENYMKAGFDEFLGKPINNEQLNNVLIKFLG